MTTEKSTKRPNGGMRSMSARLARSSTGGRVKINPAHDPNDYQMGLRHNLDMPTIMNGTGGSGDFTRNGYITTFVSPCRSASRHNRLPRN